MGRQKGRKRGLKEEHKNRVCKLEKRERFGKLHLDDAKKTVRETGNRKDNRKGDRKGNLKVI